MVAIEYKSDEFHDYFDYVDGLPTGTKVVSACLITSVFWYVGVETFYIPSHKKSVRGKMVSFVDVVDFP